MSMYHYERRPGTPRPFPDHPLLSIDHKKDGLAHYPLFSLIRRNLHAFFVLMSCSISTGAQAATPDYFNVTDYGAFGDGSSHTVQATYGLTMLSGLAGYTSPTGTHPFSFVTSMPFGVLFNLNPHVVPAAGSTTLTFQSTAVVGVKLPVSFPVALGATTAVLTDLYATSDSTAVASGTPVASTSLPGGTTVAGAPTGSIGNWTVTFSSATTGTLPAGGYLNFSVRPAASSYSLPLVAMTGIAQGDVVTGTCIPRGTQVDFVNYARMEIVLSKPTTCQVTASETLSFTPYWLTNVVAGMTVLGPTGAIPSSTTVSSINYATGVVTLSAALNSSPAIPITVDQDFLNNASPTRATPITFYRQYTDAEAANLQVDRLGIQAAINAANQIGGAVSLPINGEFLADGPIIMPIYAPFGADQPMVSLGGRSPSFNGGSIIYATKDFGPENALISCGDPTAKASNGRGLYNDTGYFCSGFLHDMRLETNLPYSFQYGNRPTWSGVPVAMNGLKQGPRLNWDRILIEDFNVGAQAVMDHTELHSSVLSGNFIGFRADDTQSGLFGDWSFDHFYSSGNGLAGMSFAPTNSWNGVSIKSYIASNPYGIYCEPSFLGSVCLNSLTLLNSNNENAGCGILKDGGIRDGIGGPGASRSAYDIKITNNYNSNGGFGTANVPIPSFTCRWASYFDMGSFSDFIVDNVATNDYATVSGAYAAVLRVQRLDQFQTEGFGGFKMSGDGVWTIIQNAKAATQNVVDGPGSLNGAFWYSGSWQYVSLEGATFKARPIPFQDSSATSLPMGSLVEYGTSVIDNVLAVQRAGQRAGAPLAGTVCQDWTGSNPNTLLIAPVVCYGGSRVPMLTASTATIGQMLKPSTTTFGTAVTSTGVMDGPAAGISYLSSTSSNLTYVNPLWAARD